MSYPISFDQPETAVCAADIANENQHLLSSKSCRDGTILRQDFIFCQWFLTMKTILIPILGGTVVKVPQSKKAADCPLSNILLAPNVPQFPALTLRLRRFFQKRLTEGTVSFFNTNI
jgi:hypothetical protein